MIPRPRAFAPAVYCNWFQQIGLNIFRQGAEPVYSEKHIEIARKQRRDPVMNGRRIPAIYRARDLIQV